MGFFRNLTSDLSSDTPYAIPINTLEFGLKKTNFAPYTASIRIPEKEMYTIALNTGSQPAAVASCPLCTNSLAPVHQKAFQRLCKGWVVSHLLVHCLHVLEQLFYDNLQCRRVKLGIAVWISTYFLLTKSPPLSRRSQRNFPLLPYSCTGSLSTEPYSCWERRTLLLPLQRTSFLRDLYLRSRQWSSCSSPEVSCNRLWKECPVCLSGCPVMSCRF